MKQRIDDLTPKIMRSGGVDIILTHAPPYGIGDREDPAHRGFQCFLPLMDELKPQYLIHGHIHLHDESADKRIRHYGETVVINACGSYMLEF